MKAGTTAVGGVETAVKAGTTAVGGVETAVKANTTAVTGVEAAVRSISMPSASAIGSAVGISVGDRMEELSSSQGAEELSVLDSEFGVNNTGGDYDFPDAAAFEEAATFTDENLSGVEAAFRSAIFGDGEGEGMYGNLISMVSTSGIAAIFTDSELILLDDFVCELVLGPVDIAGHEASWTLDLCMFDAYVRPFGFLMIGISYVIGLRIIFTRRG